jgi:hypothetical protein
LAVPFEFDNDKNKPSRSRPAKDVMKIVFSGPNVGGFQFIKTRLFDFSGRYGMSGDMLDTVFRPADGAYSFHPKNFILYS